jgi:hypothetical protein
LDDFPSSIEEDPDFSVELHQHSSSEGEESDDESYVNPYMDVDLPASKNERLQVPDAALAAAAHSLRGNQYRRKKRRWTIYLNDTSNIFVCECISK